MTERERYWADFFKYYPIRKMVNNGRMIGFNNMLEASRYSGEDSYLQMLTIIRQMQSEEAIQANSDGSCIVTENFAD
ncbi:MAG: hypothetical protein FWB97_01770 [Oscillospiraceae bacterium]|nr:hypothetical protein [Oscillospiraceae bacterium]